MEHADSLGEDLAVEVTVDSICGDEIAGAVHNTLIEFRMIENDGPEEVDGDFTKRLVPWEKICAIEIAKYPVEVFLCSVSTVV